jgi:hypothetical protein
MLQWGPSDDDDDDDDAGILDFFMTVVTNTLVLKLTGEIKDDHLQRSLLSALSATDDDHRVVTMRCVHTNPTYVRLDRSLQSTFLLVMIDSDRHFQWSTRHELRSTAHKISLPWEISTQVFR